VIVYLQPPPGAREAGGVTEAEVDLVNPYDWPKEVDLIVKRGTFPATGSIQIHLAESLFDRWQANGGQGSGIEVGATAKAITVTDEVSATIGALPLTALEDVTATLAFAAPQTGEFEVTLQEIIDGLLVGGITYRWLETDTTPPEVLGHAPPSGAQGVALDAPIVITFTEEIGPLTFGLSLTPAPDPAEWHIAWNEAGSVVTATHSGLTPDRTYTVEVTAKDAWVNPLALYSWSFTTFQSWRVYLPVVVRNH
jgi:hypothetical protein